MRFVQFRNKFLLTVVRHELGGSVTHLQLVNYTKKKKGVGEDFGSTFGREFDVFHRYLVPFTVIKKPL